MDVPAQAVLRCPACRQELRTADPHGAAAEGLACERCAADYPTEDGIPRFVTRAEVERQYPEIAEQTRAAARFYDFISVQQFLEIIGLTVDEAREEYLQRLELRPGARLLDIGAGTGAELIHVARRTPELEMHGVDISIDMLLHCRRKLTRAGLSARLYVALAERLPFADESFDVVFHTGAFNEFLDKRGAIEEMIRVARPGTRIVITDEWLTSENTRTPIGHRLRATYPSMTLDASPPIDLVPDDMVEKSMTEVFRGFGYCVEFRKPG